MYHVYHMLYLSISLSYMSSMKMSYSLCILFLCFWLEKMYDMFMILFGIGWVAPNKEALLPSFILYLGVAFVF